jgi:hypothetical protein
MRLWWWVRRTVSSAPVGIAISGEDMGGLSYNTGRSESGGMERFVARSVSNPRPGELRRAVIHLKLGDIETDDRFLYKTMGIEKAVEYVGVIRKGCPTAAITVLLQTKEQSEVERLMDAGALVANGGGLPEVIAIVQGADLLISAASTFSWYLGIGTRVKVLAMTGASDHSAGNYSGGKICSPGSELLAKMEGEKCRLRMRHPSAEFSDTEIWPP